MNLSTKTTLDIEIEPYSVWKGKETLIIQQEAWYYRYLDSSTENYAENAIKGCPSPYLQRRLSLSTVFQRTFFVEYKNINVH